MNEHCCCTETYTCPWCAPRDDTPTVDDVDVEAIAASLFWGGGM